jgi:CHASE2 domain-containing sensor protein
VLGGVAFGLLVLSAIAFNPHAHSGVRMVAVVLAVLGFMGTCVWIHKSGSALMIAYCIIVGGIISFCVGTFAWAQNLLPPHVYTWLCLGGVMVGFFGGVWKEMLGAEIQPPPPPPTQPFQHQTLPRQTVHGDARNPYPHEIQTALGGMGGREEEFED